MDIPPLIAKRLSKSGYPDIEISQAYHITYLEMHAAKENLDLDTSITIWIRLRQTLDISFGSSVAQVREIGRYTILC
jgi:hypothetical protein